MCINARCASLRLLLRPCRISRAETQNLRINRGRDRFDAIARGSATRTRTRMAEDGYVDGYVDADAFVARKLGAAALAERQAVVFT